MKLRTIVFTLAVTAACGKGDKKPATTGSGDSPTTTSGDSPKTTEAPPAPAKKALGADLFGKTVAPPGPLAKVAFGSSLDDAKKAAPEIFAKPAEAYYLIDDPAIDGVSYGVGIDKDTKKVDQMKVTVPAAAKAMIATAWGAGKDAKDTLGKPETVWLDPAGGWRAILEPGFDEKQLDLDFHPYLPAAKLLGDGPDTVGFAPQGILGATIADLRTRFGAALVEEDAAQAAAAQKQVGNFAGSDVAAQMGPAKPTVRITLPPTEWDDFETRVQIDWADDGKVDDFWFALPYQSYAPAKDELLAMFKKKWGEPKDGEYLGEKAMMFRDQAPFVVVTDDDVTHAWDVRLLAAKPE